MSLADVNLPQLGFSVAEVTLAEWLVKDGDWVGQGAPILTIESDKSAQEVDAPASGTIQILGQAGQIYPVGTLVARIAG